MANPGIGHAGAGGQGVGRGGGHGAGHTGMHLCCLNHSLYEYVHYFLKGHQIQLFSLFL